MSRYVDVDELIARLKEYNPQTSKVKVAQIVANNMPTIDIVRCKECKHNPWDFDRHDYTCVWDDDFADRPQTPDDFCSYGERSRR